MMEREKKKKKTTQLQMSFIRKDKGTAETMISMPSFNTHTWTHFQLPEQDLHHLQACVSCNVWNS